MKCALWLMVLWLLAGCPLAAQRWTPAQKTGAAAALVMIAADCGTTQAALNRGMVELNPLLGSRPSSLRLWGSCALAAATTLEIAHLMGPKRRGWVLYMVWSVETAMVVWNLRKLAGPAHRAS